MVQLQYAHGGASFLGKIQHPDSISTCGVIGFIRQKKEASCGDFFLFVSAIVTVLPVFLLLFQLIVLLAVQHLLAAQHLPAV